LTTEAQRRELRGFTTTLELQGPEVEKGATCTRLFSLRRCRDPSVLAQNAVGALRDGTREHRDLPNPSLMKFCTCR
jgi:hypothetical protein